MQQSKESRASGNAGQGRSAQAAVDLAPETTLYNLPLRPFPQPRITSNVIYSVPSKVPRGSKAPGGGPQVVLPMDVLCLELAMSLQ